MSRQKSKRKDGGYEWDNERPADAMVVGKCILRKETAHGVLLATDTDSYLLEGKRKARMCSGIWRADGVGGEARGATRSCQGGHRGYRLTIPWYLHTHASGVADQTFQPGYHCQRVRPGSARSRAHKVRKTAVRRVLLKRIAGLQMAQCVQGREIGLKRCV